MTELEAVDERQSRSGEADVNNSNSANEDRIDETTMTKKKKSVDLELFSCLLQPATASSDPIQITLAFDVLFSIGKRRMEMQWKRIRQLPKLHSQAKKLGEYADIKPAKHLSEQVHSPICMRWSSGALAGIFTSHQLIEQTTTQVSEMVITNGVEAFVGMHCNIYHCKAAALKFGQEF